MFDYIMYLKLTPTINKNMYKRKITHFTNIKRYGTNVVVMCNYIHNYLIISISRFSILFILLIGIIWLNNAYTFKNRELNMLKNVRVVEIDGRYLDTRVDGKYIVYVEGRRWVTHYIRATLLGDVDIINANSDICTYISSIDEERLSILQMMPEVIRIEQDQLHTHEKYIIQNKHNINETDYMNQQFQTFAEDDNENICKLLTHKNNYEDSILISENTDSWALEKISHYGKVDYNKEYEHMYYNHDGRNVVVYVGDSYISETEDIKHSLSYVYTGVVKETSKYSESLINHATQVASLISGKKYGIAKNANLVGIVFTEKEGLYYSNVIRAFYYIMNNYKLRLQSSDLCEKPPYAILTLSVIMPYKFWGFEQLYEKLLKQGIAIIISAGNQSTIPCDSSIYANKDVLVVGSSNVNNEISKFSNYGSCVRLYSPGENILTIGIGDKHTIATGTSFAAPIVAGVLAAFLSDPSNEGIPTKEIIDKMISCSEKIPSQTPHTKYTSIINRCIIQYVNNED